MWNISYCWREGFKKRRSAENIYKINLQKNKYTQNFTLDQVTFFWQFLLLKLPWPVQTESSPKKPNTRFLIPPHWFWAILVLAPWKQRHNCSFKRLLKFPLQNTLIKGLYFVFSLWEGDEKLGYFLYFNTSFRDWCTDSTNATTSGKKKKFWWSLANFVHVRSPVMSS